MKKSLEIYDFSSQVSRLIESIKNSKDIIRENRNLILKFANNCLAEGVSKARIIKYIYTLKTLSKLFGKSFEMVDREDMVKVVAEIEQSDYSEWTKKDFKVTLKKFFKWLRKSEEYPEEVRWLKTSLKNKKKLLPEEILTEEEVKRIASAALNARDKALVLVLYETGARIGEFLGMKFKHIIEPNDGFGKIIILNGKTGLRRIRIVASKQDLIEWLNLHPYKDDPEAYVWISLGNKNRFKPLSYNAVNNILSELAKRAGVKKKVNPHAFRHARATHLASKLTEQQLKQFMGWVQSSDMASIYVHLSGRDLDEAILQLHGISVEKERRERFERKICPRCNTENSLTAKFCSRCGFVLDKKTEEKLKEWERVRNEILNDPEFITLIYQRIKQMK